MNAERIALACAAALALATPALAQSSMMHGMAAAKTYNLTAQNGSGESGTVSLAPAGHASTLVTVSLTGAPASAQPAHIHMGSCAKLNPAPLYPLSSVINGKSTTTVKAPMAKLDAGGYAVNVHKSASDLKDYVSCADLGASAAK